MIKHMHTPRLFPIAILALFACLKLGAIPAMPGKTTVIQPDGSAITLTLEGDENLSYVRSIEGYTLIEHQGYYYYATTDSKGNLVPTEFMARDASQRKSAENELLQQIPKGITYSPSQLAQRNKKQIALSGPSNLKASGIQSGTFPTKGKHKMLMILINFSDTQPTYAQTEFEAYMNQEGFNGVGSFRDFYLENSYGQLDITTTVTRWVTVGNTHDYYGSNDSNGDDKYPRELIFEALLALNSEIDYSQFDNDRDGIVDGIAVIHQGQGEEFSGSSSTNIWSHSWSLLSKYSAAQLTMDGVVLASYTIQPEIAAGRGNTSINTIGVMCHEFGHNLGAPDYYDTSGSNAGTGYWDLMASGSWNGILGNRPAHFTAYQKAEFGWMDLTELETPGEKTLNPLHTHAEAYRVSTPTQGEFFVLENRQKAGAFESGLPGNGLMVYHVDENHIRNNYYDNTINTGLHQGMYPKAAGTQVNSASCPFPGTTGKIALTDQTTPNLLSWAGEKSGKQIQNITLQDAQVGFNFTATEPALATPQKATGSFTGAQIIQLQWNAGENGYPHYNVYRNGTLIKELTNATSITDSNVPEGLHTYEIKNINNKTFEESPALAYSVWIETAASYQVQQLKATNSLRTVTLSWISPLTLFDGFEHTPAFEVDPAGLTGWSYVDGDQKATYELLGVSYPNASGPKAFLSFNPSQTTPALTVENGQPFEGAQFLANFASDEGANDDWMISPALHLETPHKLVFFARSYNSDYGLDRIKAGWSATSQETDQFTMLPVTFQPVPDRWTRYEVEIPAHAKHFAIQSVSDNSFMLMIDHIALVSGTAGQPFREIGADLYPSNEIKNIRVTCNGVAIAENITDGVYTNQVPKRGTYTYCVESVGANGLIVGSQCTTIYVDETSVPQLPKEEEEFTLYPNPTHGRVRIKTNGSEVIQVDVFNIAGTLVRSQKQSSEIQLEGLPQGYYMVKCITTQGVFVRRIQKI